MGRFLVLCLAGLTLVAGMCCGLAWWDAHPGPRFRHALDIGGGRVLTVWSTKSAGLLSDPGPCVVHYQIDAGNREVASSMLLGDDDLGEYEFRVAQAEGGRLACVYEVTRAADNPRYFIIYDAAAGESWPCVWGAWGGTYRQALDRWRDRAGRLRAEHPDLPNPFDP